MVRPDEGTPPASPDWEFAVIARDPLARVGLAALIESADARFLAGAEYSPESLEELATVDFAGLLWEYDSDFGAGLSALAGALPTIVFVEDAAAATDAWERGAAAVLPRTVDTTTLARAVLAALAGLRVLDPALAPAHGLDTAPASPGTPRASLHPNTPELSRRESEVLALLADGASNKEIAQQLEISVNTTKFHVRSILGKLGAESRTEAVVLAARWGLIAL